VERGLRELNERAGTPAMQDEMRQDGSGQDETHSQARERETV
jgi:hypothetical protein